MTKAIVVILTDEAKSQLKKLDGGAQKRITKKLQEYSRLPNPLVYAKPMKEQYNGYYRFRVSNYRAIFDYTETGELVIIEIIRIGHRKDIYRK